MLDDKVKVIGVIMTYNCVHMLRRTLERLPKTAYTQLIVVDDGSADNTLAVAESLGLLAFTHTHLGYGGNLKFGLAKALELGADYMVEIHGDGQYASTDAALAVAKMEAEGLDFLLGSRFAGHILQPLRDGISYARYLANLGLSTIDRLILQLPLTEFHSGFRVYSAKLFDKLTFAGTSDDYLYSFEIIAQAKYYDFKVAEVPVRCDYHEEHTSISLKKSTVYAMQTFKVLGLYILSAWCGLPTKLFPKR
ncbi:MAG: glycosyltransferase family 2 protein [Patescibacteria group bacterium]